MPAARTTLAVLLPLALLAPVVAAYADPEPAADAPAATKPEVRMVEEYAIVGVDPTGEVFEVKLPSGMEEPRSLSKFKAVVVVLNRLGKDGWRVRSTTAGVAVGMDHLLKAGGGQVVYYLLAREVPYTPPEDTGSPPTDTGKR